MCSNFKCPLDQCFSTEDIGVPKGALLIAWEAVRGFGGDLGVYVVKGLARGGGV